MCTLLGASMLIVMATTFKSKSNILCKRKNDLKYHFELFSRDKMANYLGALVLSLG